MQTCRECHIHSAGDAFSKNSSKAPESLPFARKQSAWHANDREHHRHHRCSE
jgi:hypothetical protein